MTAIHLRLRRTPIGRRAFDIIARWQAFSRTPLGARLVPLYATLGGAAVGALVADRLVRSMWDHAIFTGPNQWRTVALLLVAFWLAIGAVAALAVLGPPDSDQPETPQTSTSSLPSDRLHQARHDRAPT